MNPVAGTVTMSNKDFTTIRWVEKPFDALTPAELYAVIRLRNEVFVVEQNCIFQDADNRDQESIHILGWAGNELAAYTRIVPAGAAYDEVSIGRVIIAVPWRGTGLGRELMRVSIEKTHSRFGSGPIRIGAQEHLARFYGSLGFRQDSEMYLEDGIPHIEMLLEK